MVQRMGREEERKSGREVVEQATQKEELLGAPGRRHHTQNLAPLESAMQLGI